jgi:hypothetical protein
MNRLKATNSVPFGNRDIAPASGTPQYATSGNPGVTPPTIFPAYAWNMLQDEILNVITAAGLTPDDTNWGQLLQAIPAVATSPGAAPGRLIAVRYFSTVGTFTYTPTSGSISTIEVELVGGGGAGGGAVVPGSGNVSAGAGGGGGGWGRRRITSGFSGVSYTVGAGGTPNIGGAGGAGGGTSFSTFITATGGFGGSLGNASSSGTNSLNGTGAGGTCSSGDLNAVGYAGQAGFYAAVPVSGKGGASPYGDGAPYVSFTSGGTSATNFGAGGSGGCLQGGSTAAAGGGGAAGLIIIREYA